MKRIQWRRSYIQLTAPFCHSKYTLGSPFGLFDSGGGIKFCGLFNKEYAFHFYAENIRHTLCIFKTYVFAFKRICKRTAVYLILIAEIFIFDILCIHNFSECRLCVNGNYSMCFFIESVIERLYNKRSNFFDFVTAYLILSSSIKFFIRL